MRVRSLLLTVVLGLILALLTMQFLHQSTVATAGEAEPQAAADTMQITILVDDFQPQPVQGNLAYFYNRLGGDRGALNAATVIYGQGMVTVTTTDTWGGMWNSLNHIEREGLPLDFSSILPAAISDTFQAQITGLTINIINAAVNSPNGHLKLELKNGDTTTNWITTTPKLTSGPQTFSFDLPASITDTTTLVWLLDQVNPGNYIVIDRITLTATTAVTQTEDQAFVWSYGMLLNNWDAGTGLVRDRANFPAGVFDAIQATGSLAAATAVAHQLDVVAYDDAVSIVTQISNTLLLDVPRYQGLWPHFVEVLTPTNTITIHPNTEWSTVDTAIAAIGLLEAQQALGLDTTGSEEMLQNIITQPLVLTTGISHGYSDTQELLTTTWDTFGGESWLVAWPYAAATANIVPLAHPLPPSANGSGFIDEIAWLFVPPPCGFDVWLAHWPPYLQQAANNQINFYRETEPDGCPARLNLFGLSAAEVPDPSLVTETMIYQPFGIGGQFSPPLSGSTIVSASVVVPHYSGMIAYRRPKASAEMWAWLTNQGLMTPLNNVESLMWPEGAVCTAETAVWNELKGSWNLSLQTLGWGTYLAIKDGKAPILWQAALSNPFLHNGYNLLIEGCNYLPMILRE